MGLHTTHDCWHGSYSAFAEWRNCIAEAAGYGLKLHYALGGTVPAHAPDLRTLKVTDETLYGLWERTPDDPLLVILLHSDCEGCIYPQQAGPLADALEALIPRIQDGDEIYPPEFWREKTREFVDGLRRAADTGDEIQFG